MLTTVVLTIFGPDRPGLVEKVAAHVSAHGGNWLESRLLHLGGHFAGIVRVEVEQARLEELQQGLRAADSPELRIEIQDTTPAAASSTTERSARLEIVGHDRPGIVRSISKALAQRGVNVEELATERISAPMTGEPIFQARATVTLPAEVDTATLRHDLERIAADLMVDVRVSH